MVLPPTDRLDVVTDAVLDAITAQKVPLALADIWFGEQNKIPRTPAVCVIGDGKSREPAGAPRAVMNTFHVRIDVYVMKVQDVQVSDMEVLTLADNLETVLHADLTFDGLVFGSLVVSNEQGVFNKAGTNYRSARLSLELKSKTQLPMRPGYNQ
jgi:hypothetical protein